MAQVPKPRPAALRELLIEHVRSLPPAKLAALWAIVLEEMVTLWWPPYRALDEAELLATATLGLRAYVEDLAEYSDDALRAGWRDVRRSHRTQGWPTIATIRAAVELHSKPAEVMGPQREAMFRKHLAAYERTKRWPQFLGPAPGEKGCSVPPALLLEYRLGDAKVH